MVDKKENKILSKARKNPWIISTLVFIIISLTLLVAILNTGMGGKKAGDTLVNFLNLKTGGGVSYVSSEDLGSIYEITVSYQGDEIPVYITKDGGYFVQTISPITDSVAPTNPNPDPQPTPSNVPKSDKPKVELFVMSYCPYGTQAEKGILPVVALLDDKIDFKLRMVHYVLHGEPETLENNRELCIREQEGQDILNKYLVCILDSDDPYSPKDPAACEIEAGVNSAKLQTCLKAQAADYFAADSALSQKYGVRGSPTLIINGVESNAGRSPASYLQGICAAFNNAPAECSETLSSANPSAGFGYNEGTDTVAQC